MIKPEQIPIEVMQAYYDALAKTSLGTAAIAAAINAWPNAYESPGTFNFKANDYLPHVLLPLPQEPRHESTPHPFGG